MRRSEQRRIGPGVGKTGTALWAVALAALVACGSSGPKDGTLCAHCGEEDAAACASSFVLEGDAEEFLCQGQSRADCTTYCEKDKKDLNGNGVFDDYVCVADLVCAHQAGTPARRCYPAPPGSQTPVADFGCEGLRPAA